MKLKMLAGTTLFILTVLFTASSFAAETQRDNYKPDDGYVSSEVTALSIAEAVLSPIYGQEQLDAEKPFKAVLKDGIWTVEGTLPCPDGEKCLGGVAVIDISKDDGRILRVSHGK